MKIKTYLTHLRKDARYKIALFTTAAMIIPMITAAVFVYANGNNQNITISDKNQQKGTYEETISDESTETSGTAFVDLEGCVKKPGVYEVPYGSRVFEVIEKAGGLSKDADTSGINQAETVSDGMKLDIPSKSDRKEEGTVAGEYAETSSENGLININTADSQTLQQITGVGPVTAEKIIRYREENGAFHSIEEITSVNGIGQKTFEKIRSQITC